ncbi:MAG: glycosyltransferase, partial [Verrucomicrobiota bacterium]
VRDVSAQKLEGGSDLHGNTTGYGNFYLAEDLLPEVDQCLSLDADILVHTDVHKMFEYFDGENVLLVDGTAKRDWDRHSELYKTAGLDMTKPCFNAGIAGFDLKLWRELNITNKCKEVAIQYSHMLKGADQAILNVALHDKFLAWGKKYNHSLRLKNPQIKEMEDVIYHFVGAPKPWDLFGKQLHNNFPIWYDVYKRTAIGKTPLRKYISLNRARKTWRSTARVWLEKIKSK